MRGNWMVLFILMFLSGLSARAEQLFEYQRPIRALGMGGVFLPFVDENNAVLWNPAVLSTVDQISWQLFEFGTGLNGQEVYDLYRAMQDSGCTGAACYSEFYGKPLWVAAQAKMSLVGPRVGIAAFSSNYLEGTLHNPAFPTLNLTYLSDLGFAAAYGFPIEENLHGGVTVKRITRNGGIQDVSLSTVTSGGSAVLDDFDQRGTGYGFDLGLQYKTPGFANAIFAAHWQDVGSTAFIREGNHQAPPRVKDNLSVGLGTEIDLPGLDLRTGVELRHLTDSNVQTGKKIHMGAELGLPFIDVRTGLYQGYPTVGATVDLFFLQVDVASYTEEVGIYPGQSPSHRYKIGISLDLAIDADFRFTTKDGKRRKLKQRR